MFNRAFKTNTGYGLLNNQKPVSMPLLL